MTSKEACMKAAQAWCTAKTEKIVMDPTLAEAFACIIDDLWLNCKGIIKSTEPDKHED